MPNPTLPATELNRVKAPTGQDFVRFDDPIDVDAITQNGDPLVAVDATARAAAASALARANHTGTQLLSTISDVTTVGGNIAKLANPGAVRFLRVNADNTVTARSAAELASDLGVNAVLPLLYMAYVSPQGSNLTGQLGNPSRPFRTFDAAAAASAAAHPDEHVVLWVEPGVGGVLTGAATTYFLHGTCGLSRVDIETEVPLTLNGNGGGMIGVTITGTAPDGPAVEARAVNLLAVSLVGAVGGANGGNGRDGGSLIAANCVVSGPIQLFGGAGGEGQAGVDAYANLPGDMVDGGNGGNGGNGGTGGYLQLGGCEIREASYFVGGGSGGGGGGGGAGINSGGGGSAGLLGSDGTTGTIVTNSNY